MNGSGAFLANGRNQHFALIARDGISGSFDMTQSACLSGLTLRARRSRRTVGSLFATFASHALWARGTLPTGASLRTGGSGWARRPLWSHDIPGDQALRGSAGRTLSDDPDRTAVGVDARENLLLGASAYGHQRQSHGKCSSNSRYSRHDVSPVAFIPAASFWRMPPLPPRALQHERKTAAIAQMRIVCVSPITR